MGTFEDLLNELNINETMLETMSNRELKDFYQGFNFYQLGLAYKFFHIPNPDDSNKGKNNSTSIPFGSHLKAIVKIAKENKPLTKARITWLDEIFNGATHFEAIRSEIWSRMRAMGIQKDIFIDYKNYNLTISYEKQNIFVSEKDSSEV